MARHSASFLIVTLLWALCVACTQDPFGSDPARDMRIQLQVSGGIAGVGYAVSLSGSTGVLKGESCVAGCDFDEGDVLEILGPEQVQYIRDLFENAAIHLMDGQEFVQCCDQFYYELRYEDSHGKSIVRGNSGAFPPSLGVAVTAVQGLLEGTVPVIVDFSTVPVSWPQDAFQIQEADVASDFLQVEISYGGGCRTHDVNGVAWGGWMESNPVQVRLFLSHEDFDDPCDAWITRNLRFDLGPLKKAYQDSYGVAAPGTTTLILLLADPLVASPLGARVLEYIF